jgi:hypothetical protein
MSGSDAVRIIGKPVADNRGETADQVVGGGRIRPALSSWVGS